MRKLLLAAVLLGVHLAAASALAQLCTPAGCDDGNPCTDDICDPTLGCRYFNNSASCTDGNSCTTNDVCSQGACVGGPPAAGCTACQAAAALPGSGGTFVGTTSGSGTLAGSCGTSQASPERVYRWTPTSSGVATFQTCGTGTNYDSVVYVRSGSCTGSQLSCNDDGPCATSNSSDLGSRTTASVTAGQTYYIVVDGYNGRSGTYALNVQPPSVCGNGVREGAEACDGADNASCSTHQCTSQCTCVPPAQGLPDLSPEILGVSLQRQTSVAAGDVAEGCAESTSNVDLLRFGVRMRNEGTADLFFGDPGCPECSTHPLAACTNPNYTCSPAEGHNHPHYSNYARYELLDPTNQAVVVGHKQGFCLLDLECNSPKYSCSYQGITAGCNDVYAENLGCQYLDVTGVAPGNYTLRVTVDPFGRIAESQETDNVATTPVTITAPGSSSCTSPAVIPAAGGVIDGTTAGGSSSLSGGCANTSGAPEKVFAWTPSASGTATIQTCSATNTTFDTVLYLRNGSCQNGSQAACNDDTAGCAMSTNSGYASRITPTVTAGQTYYVVVDGYGSSSGSFRLTVTPPSGTPPPPPPPPPPPSGGSCTSPTVIPAAGGSFGGTTSGSSTASGSCGNTGSAPEKVFQWTPARSGTATISTCAGTSTRFDTVVYMRAGNCTTGSQTACNDDTPGCDTFTGGGTGSRITPTVTAGQTYFIFVDGYGTGSGNFALTVTPPP